MANYTEKKINTGVNPDDWKKEAHNEKDYYIGAGMVSKTILFPNGHGQEKYLPNPEFQRKNKVETMACVPFSHNNCLEVYANYFGFSSLLKTDFNISDRELAKASGTTMQGNSPNNVCETFRKKGFVWEWEWPFDDNMTWAEFYATLPSAIVNKAVANIMKFDYAHEWVSMRPAAMKQALQFGPIQAIGYSWIKDSNTDLYIDAGYSPNHAFVVFDYKEGQYWLAYDTYAEDFQFDGDSTKPEFIKKLAWDFAFGDYGKQMTLKMKSAPQNLTLLAKLKKLMNNIWGYADDHGLHFYFVKSVNNSLKKQLLDVNSMTIELRALYISMLENGIIKTTSWPEISHYADYKFF